MNTVQNYSIPLSDAITRIDIARLRVQTEKGLESLAQSMQEHDIYGYTIAEAYVDMIFDRIDVDNIPEADALRYNTLRELLLNSVKLADVLRRSEKQLVNPAE